MEQHYPFDWANGIYEAREDAEAGQLVASDLALIRSRQRFRTRMVRNAAYWCGYSRAASEIEGS